MVINICCCLAYLFCHTRLLALLNLEFIPKFYISTPASLPAVGPRIIQLKMSIKPHSSNSDERVD